MRELNSADLEAMRLPRRFWSAFFDKINGPNGDGSEVRTMIAGYVSNIHAMRNAGAGLLIWGPNGTGKTSIGSVILKHARRMGFTCLFINTASLKDVIVSREIYDQESGLTLWNRAKIVDFLLLDDLGKGSQDSTGFGERMIDELIRARYADNRCTIITTNIPKSNLTDFIKPSTLHILKGSSAQIKVDFYDFRVEEGKKIRDLINGGKQ